MHPPPRRPNQYRRTKFAVLAVAGLIILGLVKCRGATVTLAWEPSPDERTSGYTIYATNGHFIRHYVGLVTNATLSGLDPGRTYFFYVTARSYEGRESEPSNIVEHRTKSSLYTVTIEAAETVTGPWFQRYSSPIPNPFTFVRIQSHPIKANGWTNFVITTFSVSDDGIRWLEWWRETVGWRAQFYKCILES